LIEDLYFLFFFVFAELLDLLLLKDFVGHEQSPLRLAIRDDEVLPLHSDLPPPLLGTDDVL